MKRFLPLLAVCLLPRFGLAVPLTLSTATNPQGASLNQGLWSNASTSNNAYDNYPVGSAAPGTLFRSFFGFDTSALSGLTINSATLVLDYGYGGGGAPTLTFDLAAVTTPIATLVQKGNNPDLTIFNSLAGGTSYGSYSISTSINTGAASLVLNSAALADLLAAASSGNFFVLGGSSVEAEAMGGVTYLFASPNGLAATLVLDIGPSVPELDGSQFVSAFSALALLTLACSRRVLPA